MFLVDFSKNYRGMTDLKRKNSSLSYVMLYFQQNTANQMRLVELENNFCLNYITEPPTTSLCKDIDL